MPLHHLGIGKTSLLELPVYVACEHERAEGPFLTPPAQELEATMRYRCTVQIHSMAENAPS
jgi:hypothetical protein